MKFCKDSDGHKLKGWKKVGEIGISCNCHVKLPAPMCNSCRAYRRGLILNPLKPSGIYLYRLLSQSVTMRSLFVYFCMVHVVHIDISLNNTNDSIIVMVKCGVLFEVRTEFLNIILMNFGFEGLNNR
jgi:hypothetical protein